MRGHLCVRKQTRTEKGDMSLHEDHSTGRHRARREGIEPIYRKGLNTMGNSDYTEQYKYLK